MRLSLLPAEEQIRLNSGMDPNRLSVTARSNVSLSPVLPSHLKYTLRVILAYRLVSRRTKHVEKVCYIFINKFVYKSINAIKDG